MSGCVLEVCCGTLGDVAAAVEGGADRVELCSALSCGGVTPSRAMIAKAVEICKDRCRLHVLIRPREGDFVYTAPEVALMIEDIELACALGADGVVVGALTADGCVDTAVTRRLVDAAGSMSVTFSRAFDVAADDTARSVEAVIGAGCHRLLTSGCAPTAMEGYAVLRRIVAMSAGRLGVIAASGITAYNCARVAALTGVGEIHGSFRTNVASSVSSRPLPGLEALLPRTHASIVSLAKSLLS